MPAMLTPEQVSLKGKVAIVTGGGAGIGKAIALGFSAVGAKVALLAWTYGKSQKVRNLERDPRATVQIEAGRDQYAALRGVMLECDVEVERDPARVADVGFALMARYAGPGADDAEAARAGVLKQAPKRVALRFTPTRVVSWDHRKLGGTY